MCVCTPAFTYVYVTKVFAGPGMEENFYDFETVCMYVCVCVNSKSHGLLVLKAKIYVFFYCCAGKQTQNIHLGHDNQMPRKEKYTSASTLRRSSYPLLFSSNIKTTAKKKSLS